MWWILILVGIVSPIVLIILIALICKKKPKILVRFKFKFKHRFYPKTERAGLYGEFVVDFYLKDLLKEDEYLLTNIIIPKNRYKKTEIDAVIVSNKGVFCIEIKNWVGRIKGSDQDEYWTQKYDDHRRKNRKVFNPVKQNQAHIRALNRILNNQIDIHNIVIFLRGNNKLRIRSDYVYSLRKFMKTYRKLPNNILKPELVNAIYQRISVYKATTQELKQFKEERQARYNYYY